MLQSIGNRSASRKRASCDNAINDENMSPVINKRTSELVAAQKIKRTMSPRDLERSERKRRRKKEAERQFKRKQQAKQALKKQQAQIQQAVATHILQLQAKQDRLQRKITEYRRLETYDKAKIASEEVRAIRAQVHAMEQELANNPLNLQYLLTKQQETLSQPDLQTQVEQSKEQQTTSEKSDDVGHNDNDDITRTNNININNKSVGATNRRISLIQQDAQHVSQSLTPQRSVNVCASAPAAMFSPAPSAHGLPGPSSASSRQQPPSRRKSRNIGPNSVSTHQSSVAGSVGNTIVNIPLDRASTPQSLKMDQIAHLYQTNTNYVA